MPPMKFDKLEQPPLDGPMWPRVLGQRLASRKMGPGGNLSGTLGFLSVDSPYLMFPALTVVSYYLGPKAKIFYLASVFFAFLSAQQAYRRWAQ